MKFKLRTLAILMTMSILFALAGCGGSGGGDSGGGSGSTGTVSLSLTDAPVEGYKAVYVTIEKVEVHKGDGNWTTITDLGNGKTYNLLDLAGGVREELGITELATGHYTQMRLILGKVPEEGGINFLSQPHLFANYVIIDTDPTTDTDPIEIHELKVPSGFQTGIKIVQGFDIIGSQTTELVIDFDADKSVVKAGSSGNWLLKPTIKVLNTKECAIVSGDVKAGDAFVPGALVSAQQNQEVVSSTLTAEDGTYELLFLNTGEPYKIVASKSGYNAMCIELTTSGVVGVVTLAPTITTQTGKTGTLAATVTITPPSTVPDDTPYVTLSFRQNLDCDGDDTPDTLVEVKSGNYASATEAYKIPLTVGDYELDASTYGYPPKQYDMTIAESPPAQPTEIDIIFPEPTTP